jgi:hypothetical protein
MLPKEPALPAEKAEVAPINEPTKVEESISSVTVATALSKPTPLAAEAVKEEAKPQATKPAEAKEEKSIVAELPDKEYEI